MNQSLYHACSVQIDGWGIIIMGPSGSGKTSTALGLLSQAKVEQKAAHLISDDQVFLHYADSRLTARVPEPIAGKVELRGFGIVEHAYIEQSPIHLVTQIIDDAQIERMPEPTSIELESTTLPLVYIPQKHEELATRIVFAWLNANS